MKKTAKSIRLAGAVLAILALASCSSNAGSFDDAGGKPKRTTVAPTLTPAPAETGAPDCKLPKEVDYPDWIPEDLPLPDGTYAYKNLAPLGGYKRALFVMTVGTRPFIKLVLREWPKAGYVLGRGDAEPGEVEDDFRKPPAVGAFKANDVYCTPGYTVMYMIWAEDGPKDTNILPTPTSTGSPLSKK
jgi:hypothetical protein